MIPVQNDTSLDKLTKSTSITEPKMMSNPQYIDSVFQKMVKSNRVHFKTVFDDSSDLDFYDFGIQVVQPNDHKDTSKNGMGTKNNAIKSGNICKCIVKKIS